MQHTNLSHQIWPVAADANLIRNLTLAIIGSLIVALAAQINVPMIPVPMTLQTLAVLAIGAAYGSKLGAGTLALYAVEGVSGLPVFAEMNSLFKPDGTMIASIGYIVGFIPAAYVVGWLAERGWDRNPLKLIIACLLGAAILYIPGLLWLNTLIGDWNVTIAEGLSKFILGDVIKAVVAALGIPAAWSLLGKTPT
jgi:biotin transport system substrate-specific component